MHLGWDCLFTLVSLAVCAAAPPTPDEDQAVWKSPAPNDTAFARETPPTGPWVPPQRIGTRGARYEPTIWRRGIHESVQVNVDNYGQNIPGDAANEPSLAVDPTDPNKMVIGWRQFNRVSSLFREPGWAYSHNGGAHWTFPGSIAPGVFGSDPVLEPDSDGNFYYATINDDGGWLYRSSDGGMNWGIVSPFWEIGGPDKEWMVIDRSGGLGHGNIYLVWSTRRLARSIDFGASFVVYGSTGLEIPFWGTLAVGHDGALYVVDARMSVVRSDNAQDRTAVPSFGPPSSAGFWASGYAGSARPNPDGLIAQSWIATDSSLGPTRGRVYVLACSWRDDLPVPNARFAGSADRAISWSPSILVSPESGWQWFGMMDVAPNGRIDALWNDTRNTGAVNLSELHYSFSFDGGENWSPAVAVSPVFDSWVGWPSGNKKLGDYYDLTSDARGVNVAYAATFNGEQDIYFLRIEQDCNGNEVPDHVEIAKGYAPDCNDNLIPDECETFGDCTCDWIVTLADHAALVDCMTGPALPPYQGGTEGGSPTRTDDGTAPHQHRDRYGAGLATGAELQIDRSLSLAVLKHDSHEAVNAWDDRTSARVALEGRPNDRLENRSHTGARSPRLAEHNPLPPACHCADSHRDGAVDLADFARLQRFLTAP